MYSLYIDTHFVNLVLALFKDDRLLEKKELNSNKHSSYTINLLKELLNNNNVVIDNLNEIIVINGPGSFTGVRIGIVIAKIMGFTKNIKLKTLSYLEALALNYNCNVTLGIKDQNGVFIGEFDEDHNLVNDYYYLSNKELDKFDKEIVFDDYVDMQKMKEYIKNKDSINPHELVPLYVKRIEVEK